MNKKKKLPNGWIYLGSAKEVEMTNDHINYNNNEDEIDENLIEEYIETYEEFYNRTLHCEFFYPDDDEDDFENEILEIIS